MEQTDSFQRGGEAGDWVKEGEGISQRTCIHIPQTQTTARWWTGAGGRGQGGGGQRGGKMGTYVIVYTREIK